MRITASWSGSHRPTAYKYSTRPAAPIASSSSERPIPIRRSIMDKGVAACSSVKATATAAATPTLTDCAPPPPEVVHDRPTSPHNQQEK